MTKWQ